GDIGLADRVLKLVADRVQRQRVAWPLLLRTAQRRAVEGEAGVADRLRQHARLAVERVEHQPILPGVERLRSDQRRQSRDRPSMIGFELLDAAELRGVEKR